VAELPDETNIRGKIGLKKTKYDEGFQKAKKKTMEVPSYPVYAFRSPFASYNRN
jgi:hypothetical protein